ncbi:MAG: aldo/keto reductase [Chloroflexota bacterium]|nr:aldo/keto reductase [Chloroflexota bacterium]MDE2961125.1 aldo/keto reductase [Chloroflexota bacterium]
MNYERLGSSSLMVPEIGLGTWRYTGGPEPLRRGVELGANLIDTAEMYRTEAAVGEAIAGIRDQVIVATKVLGSHLRYDEVLRAAEQSLRLLAVDRIDLYQIHWPNPRVPVAETMRAMDRLVSDGAVAHVGVSNFSVDEMREAQAAMPNVPIVSNQILYNLRRRSAERDVIPYCRRNNMTVIAYSPLHEGALVGNRGGRLRRALGRNRDNDVLEEVAGEVGKTAAQVALNWVADQTGIIAIPKSNSVERTAANCEASGWSLTTDQRQALERAFPI